MSHVVRKGEQRGDQERRRWGGGGRRVGEGDRQAKEASVGSHGVEVFMEGVEGCHKEERGEGGALGSAPVGWDGGEDLSIEGRLRGGAVE